jgi:hypothetical protein
VFVSIQVALKAARLATEAHPSSASTWETRLDLEAEALGVSTAVAAATAADGGPSEGGSSQQQQQHRQQLFALVVQALKQVPAAAAGHIWDLGFDVATATAAAGSNAQLAALQKQLLAAVTAAAVRGPDVGGLGAVVGRCLEVTWGTSGAAAARKLWQQQQLLPPAGGDMFRAMVGLERATLKASGSSKGDAQQQQQQQQLTAEAVKRVRAVYEAWAGAYGSQDAGLWVEWAVFEQQQGKAGAGNVYWRAVKALDEPEGFIAEYRQQVGVA